MAYTFRKGSHFSGNAEEVYYTLERIREENDNKLTTDDVIRHASDRSSPLHSHFEWDDSVAAHQYRKWTARRLIRAVVYVEEQESRPVFINVTRKESGDGSRYYQNINVATRDEFASALDQLNGKLRSLGKTIATIEQYSRSDEQKQIAMKLREQTDRYVEDVQGIID